MAFFVLYSAVLKGMKSSLNLVSFVMQISYLFLTHHTPILAMWLADVPKPLLEIFDDVARAVVALRNPDYHLIHPDIHVRVTHLPIHDNLRELRHVRGDD